MTTSIIAIANDLWGEEFGLLLSLQPSSTRLFSVREYTRKKKLDNILHKLPLLIGHTCTQQMLDSMLLTCVCHAIYEFCALSIHTHYSRIFFFVLFSFGCKLLKCTDSVSVYLCYLVLFQLEQLNGQKANRLREFYPQLQASSTSWPTLYVLTRAFQHIRARIPVHCRVCSLWVLSPYVIDFAQKKKYGSHLLLPRGRTWYPV